MGLQIVATVCMFLASKADETPCGLDRIVVVAYETMHKRDPAAARRVRQKVLQTFIVLARVTIPVTSVLTFLYPC